MRVGWGQRQPRGRRQRRIRARARRQVSTGPSSATCFSPWAQSALARRPTARASVPLAARTGEGCWPISGASAV